MTTHESHLNILSTRPQSDSNDLAQLLSDLPVSVFPLPASVPQLRPWNASLQAMFTPLADLYFFPSRHAVPILQHLSPTVRQQLVCACPGPGTARRLKEFGVGHVVVPESEYTSEALLAMAQLQSMKGQKVVLLTAPGGRDLVSETLSNRGAQVDTLMVYDRVQQEPDSSVIARLSTSERPLLTLVTSAQGLQYLARCLPVTLWEKLQHAPMLVPSLRVKEHATALGIKSVKVLSPPNNGVIAHYIRTNFDTLIMHDVQA